MLISSFVEGGRETMTGPMSTFLFGGQQTNPDAQINSQHIFDGIQIIDQQAIQNIIQEKQERAGTKVKWSSILKTGASLLLGTALIGIGGPMFFGASLVMGFSAIRSFSKSFEFNKKILRDTVQQSVDEIEAADVTDAIQWDIGENIEEVVEESEVAQLPEEDITDTLVKFHEANRHNPLARAMLPYGKVGLGTMQFYDRNNYGDEKITKDKIADAIDLKRSKIDTYSQRIEIDSINLRKVYSKFQEQGITIKRVETFTGIHSSNVFQRQNRISKVSFEKLKVLMVKELGPNSIFELFGQADIPHKVFIGYYEELSLKKDGDTAEFVGIALGDAHVGGKKLVSITLNEVDEAQYVQYVKSLVDKIFPDMFYFGPVSGSKAINILSAASSVQQASVSLGLVPGDKVQNQVGIPSWILSNREYMIRCLKGLFDTDGSVVLDKGLERIILRFNSASKPLVEGFRLLCVNLDIKTGAVTGPYERISPVTGEKSYIYHVQVASYDEIKKFIEIVKPEKILDPYRRRYIGSTMIYKTLLPDNMIKRALEAKIHFDFPKSSERKFSKSFSMYLSFLVEKVLILSNFKTVCGLPYNDVLTKSMVDRAVEYSYTPKQIIFSRDKTSVKQLRGDLKFRICGLLAEIISRHGASLADTHLLNLFKNEMSQLDHFELILKYENPVLSNTLDSYFLRLVGYVRDIISTSSIPIYLLSRRYGIADRDAYAIYRYLVRNFPAIIP